MLNFGNKIKNHVIIISTILIALLFSQWGLKQLWLEIDNCCDKFGYLHHDFYFYPYFSVFVSDIIRKFFGIYGLILIGQIILPAASFYLIAKVFNRDINKLWSITIAFVALISFPQYPFREFLINLLWKSNNFKWDSNSFPEILNFPIPSFSTFIFLLVFYHAIKLVKLDIKRTCIFTFLFSLQFYINAIDALFGICFWFAYFVIRWMKTHRGFKLKDIVKFISLQVLILGGVTFFAFFNANFSTGEKISPITFNILFYYTAYFIVPILLTAVLYLIHKIDYHEIIYKFWPIYIMMIVEFLLVYIAYMFRIGVNLEILSNRIPLFFLHFYYYLPVIFYATRNYYSFSIGNDAKVNILRKIVFFVFNKLSYIYLPVIILFVLLFGLLSSNHNFEILINN